MNKLNNYYNKLTMSATPEDMAQRVISADTAEKPKRMAFRKPAVIAAAAAVLMVGGVTAGAATGLFNFNEVFHSVNAESEELGEKLLGEASNIKTTISDDDYVVALKGVTGSPASLLANIEISRADGKPISGLNNTYIYLESVTLENDDSFSGGSYFSTINEQGNICIDWEHRLGYEKLLAGELLTDGTVSLSGNVDLQDGGETKTLDWTLEFDYTPTEESLRTVKAADVSENCTLNVYGNLDETEFADCELDVNAITLTSTFGVLDAKLLNGDSVEYGLDNTNDVRLIKNDGYEIVACIHGYRGNIDGDIDFTMSYYADGSYINTLAVDVSEIKAISINGTVYELS